MSLEIVQRTVSSETTNRLKITDHSVARTVSVGTTWNRIRMGFRWSTSRTTAWTGASDLYMGMTAGNSSLPGDPTCPHFVGWKTAGDWEVDTGWMNLDLKREAIIKNGALSSGSDWGNIPSLPPNGTALGSIIFDMTKLSSIWILQLYYKSKSHATQADLLLGLQSTGTPAGYTAINNATPNREEATYGSLDSVCFAFMGVTESIEITDFGYRVLS